MTNTMLTRTKSVLIYKTYIDGHAMFTSNGDYKTITIDWDTWKDLGQPNKVTVTIEPGDKLD